MIDLEFAKTVSRPFMQSGPLPDLGVDLQALSQQSLQILEAYTGLSVKNVPHAEMLTREKWVEMNLKSSQPVFSLIEEKLEKVSSKKAATAPSLLQSFSKIASGMLVSSEVGLIFGFMSQRVLGQVEAAIFLPSDEPLRLVFVAENLQKAAQTMGVDEKEFYHWVVLHELTHVFQFAGVSWLKPYLSTLMKQYLEEAKGQSFGLSDFKISNMNDLQEKIKKGGIPALVSSPAQQEHMKKVQATMALIEGYAEHVMDATGEMVLQDYKALRDSMESRRSENKNGLSALVFKMLGMDMKMRQYEEGRKFCNYIAENHGIATLNKVWDKSENLPSEEEVADPKLWVKRVGAASNPEKAKDNLQAAVQELQSQSKTLDVPQIIEKQVDDALTEEIRQKIYAKEDEDYLIHLIRTDKDKDLPKEMQAWIERALNKGYIRQDTDGGYSITAKGYQRLDEVLKSDV